MWWKSVFVSSVCATLESLCAWIGFKKNQSVNYTSYFAPVNFQIRRKRYKLSELMKGVTIERVKALLDSTAWALEGEAVGFEIILCV